MKIGVLFPGQGSQYVGMADPWLDHPAGRARLEAASEVLGWDVVAASRDTEALKRTDVVQLAILACDLAAFDVLSAGGVRFHAAAGHSLGEYAALAASGAVEFEQGLTVLATRAAAMQAAAQENPGGMTALIGVTLEQAREVCEVAGRGDVLTVANDNGARQVVLAGSIPAIEKAEELARGRGAKAVRLQVAGAFHSPLMEPAVQPVREAISKVTFHRPRFPVVPNASGRPTAEPLALRDLLARHLISPVLWDATIRNMAGLGIEHFLEAGPGQVLGKLTRRILPGANVRFIGSPADAHQAAEELVGTGARPTMEEAR